MSISKKEFRELQKAAMKIIRKMERSAKDEPSTIIICGSRTEEPERVVEEITSWLFHRRQDDGRTGN